jgi:hypothetical protein
MKFGNWNILGNTIEWSGNSLQRFVINRESLLDTTPSPITGIDLYKWIVLATDEEWLTHDDLYDLNFAFVFAAGGNPQEFDYALFDRTVEYQFDILEDEDEEEDEDD